MLDAFPDSKQNETCLTILMMLSIAGTVDGRRGPVVNRVVKCDVR